jgi:CBS domain-containing protein
MDAADVMTRQVVSINADASISEAAEIMLSKGISGLPVIGDQGNLIGIVTEGDLLRRVETGTTRRRSRWLEFIIGPGRLASEYVQSHSRKVRDVMTPDPEVVKEDTPIESIVLIMENKRIKRLPVVERDKLVGIVSRANLVQALASLSRELRNTIPGDKEIQERVLAEIERQGWSSATAFNLIVRDGVVELWGTILDERARDALRVAAENVPGVKQVKDHLIWVDPVSGMAVDARGLVAR